MFPFNVFKSKKKSTSDSELIAEAVFRSASFPDPTEHAQNIAHTLEAWPDELHRLSFKSFPLDLTQGEITLLMHLVGSVNLALQTYETAADAWDNADQVIEDSRVPASDGSIRLIDLPAIVDLIRAIDVSLEAMRNFQEHPIDRPLFKLGTRSPKDSPFWAVSNGRVKSGSQVMLLLLTSIRIMHDIINEYTYQTAMVVRLDPTHPEYKEHRFEDESVRNEYAKVPPHMAIMWFREYLDLDGYQEIRAFMRGGQFVGATQYHGIVVTPDASFMEAEAIPEFVDHGYEYEAILKEWFPKFKSAAKHYEDAVFDVLIDRKSRKVILMETNPFGKTTFPGLMIWSHPDTFNGEFQWAGKDMFIVDPSVPKEMYDRIRKTFGNSIMPIPYEMLQRDSMPSPSARSLTMASFVGRIVSVVSRIRRNPVGVRVLESDQLGTPSAATFKSIPRSRQN